jgi:hypothetical protein
LHPLKTLRNKMMKNLLQLKKKQLMPKTKHKTKKINQSQQLKMSLVFMSKLIMLNLLMKIMNPKMNWMSFQKNLKVIQKTS